MADARYFCVVPAAGAGSRFGQHVAKQHHQLADATVLEVTTSRLLALNIFDRIVLVLAANDAEKLDSELAANHLITTAIGGSERSKSVLSGLLQLTGIAEEQDWVMVHDAARPCFNADDVLGLATKTADGDCGGLLAVPMSDTLKRSDGGRVVATVDRSNLWCAQTPQCYRYKALCDAMSAALEAGVVITDESSAIEWAGGSPIIVEGSTGNIKITRPEDLSLAEYYLRESGYWE